MQTLLPSQLKAAVTALCPDVAFRANTMKPETDERLLWRELSSCLLSSQVPYDLAVAAALAIEDAGILLRVKSRNVQEISGQIADVLSQPFEVRGRHRHYRFRISKSNQLARTCFAVRENFGDLHSLLKTFDDDHLARDWFLRNAPGVGPKQASMFLRNIGFTYQLAVLDRHVLRYMAAVDIEVPAGGASGRYYYDCEKSL